MCLKRCHELDFLRHLALYVFIFWPLQVIVDLVKLACPSQIKIGQCYWYKNKPLKDNRNNVFRDIHHWFMYDMNIWFEKMRKWNHCKTKTNPIDELETRVVYQNNYLVNILTENNTWHRLSCNGPSVLTIYMTLKINCTMKWLSLWALFIFGANYTSWLIKTIKRGSISSQNGDPIFFFSLPTRKQIC